MFPSDRPVIPYLSSNINTNSSSASFKFTAYIVFDTSTIPIPSSHDSAFIRTLVTLYLPANHILSSSFIGVSSPNVLLVTFDATNVSELQWSLVSLLFRIVNIGYSSSPAYTDRVSLQNQTPSTANYRLTSVYRFDIWRPCRNLLSTFKYPHSSKTLIADLAVLSPTLASLATFLMLGNAFLV